MGIALGLLAPRLDAALIVPGSPTPFAAILTSDPKQQAALEPAIEQFKRRDFEQALRLFTAAHEKEKTLPPRLAFARLLLADNQVPAGRALLEQVVLDLPNDPLVYLTLGNAAILEGRLTDAQLEFEKARSLIAAQKDTSVNPGVRLSDCLDGLAAVWENRKKWKEASAILQEWIASDAKNGPARQRYARTLFFQGNTDGALAELKKASELDKDLSSPAVTMGSLFAQKEEHKKADEWFKKAVEEAPRDPKAHQARASWLLGQERIDEAKTEADAAAKLDPNSTSIRAVQGTIAMFAKNYPEAEKVFEELNRKNPSDLSFSNQLALALAEQPDSAKQQRAVQYAEMNARQYPRSPATLATLGRVYYRIGRLEDAEKALQASINVSGNRTTSDVLYYLAFVYADRGQLDKVKDVLEKALGAKGAFLFRKEAKEWMDRMASRP